MSAYAQEKDLQSTESPPPAYPMGTGAPFVAGGLPQQNSAVASPYGMVLQQVPYQQTSLSQHSVVVQPMYALQPQVIITQPIMMSMSTVGGLGGLGLYAAACLCPGCGQNQVTRVTYQSGKHTHVWAVILGVVLGCCCIPYLVNGFKDVRHHCSSCGIPLAVYHRSGGLEVLARQAPVVAMQPQVTGVVEQPVPLQPKYTGTPILSSPAPLAQTGGPAGAPVVSGPPVYTGV